MELSREDVAKIGKLARIELNDDEITEFAKELTQILDYVDQLSEVDTENVEPIAHVTGIANTLREDEPKDYPKPDALIEQAPDYESGQIKTKKVLP